MKNKHKIFGDHFDAAFFIIDGMVMSVLHKNDGLDKLEYPFITKWPGGTFYSLEEVWESLSKTKESNDHFLKLRYLKVLETIKLSLGENYYTGLDSDLEIFSNYVASSFITNETFKMAIETIEETGIIPVAVDKDFYFTQRNKYTQNFFIITDAYTYSKDRERFIEVKTEIDLPKRNVDYKCLDEDIFDVAFIPINEVFVKRDGFKLVFNHIAPFKEYLRHVS